MTDAASPYRGGPSGSARRAAPTDLGLVGDLIRQFADPLAFYRELVQNAIDAGATEITVTMVWEPGVDGEPGVMRVSVRDDGSGMSREILENELTVLFKSSKEDRDDAIGKFGVGFVSVLAVSPEVVVVDSSLGDGVLWSLHLHPDQSYDLFRREGAKTRGTTVSLHIPVPHDEHVELVQRSEAALKRWCRHARVPIQLVAFLSSRGEPERSARIDEPLGIEGLVTATARSRDGLTHVVCALPARGGRYAAFYNQGLLLHETNDHELGELAFKVMDARLEHTLSRDNVRRDHHYERAMALVASTLRGPLMRAIGEAFARAAEVYARGGKDGASLLLRLLEGVAHAEIALDGDQLVLPVLAEDGVVAMAASALRAPIVSWEGPSPLARGLIRTGRHVIDGRIAENDGERSLLMTCIAETVGAAPARDRDRFSLIEPISVEAAQTDWLDEVAAQLAELARRPASLRLALVHGHAEKRLCLSGGSEGEPWIVEGDAVSVDPFRLLMRPPLIVRADHPIAKGASELATRDRTLAVTLMTRAILAASGALTRARDLALTERGLRALLGSAGG